MVFLWSLLTCYSRPPLPTFVTEEFLKRVPNAIMATNPCRLQYCTQEIVVVREDLVTKMCRNNIHFPTEGEIPDHVSTSNWRNISEQFQSYWKFKIKKIIWNNSLLIITVCPDNNFPSSPSTASFKCVSCILAHGLCSPIVSSSRPHRDCR